MNPYGGMAKHHWSRWLPQRYATLSDPERQFSDLGEMLGMNAHLCLGGSRGTPRRLQSLWKLGTETPSPVYALAVS